MSTLLDRTGEDTNMRALWQARKALLLLLFLGVSALLFHLVSEIDTRSPSDRRVIGHLSSGAHPNIAPSFQHREPHQNATNYLFRGAHRNVIDNLRGGGHSILTNFVSGELTKSAVAPNPVRTAVVIVTQMRSGSSFVGQLFNQHPDIFYVYEPLWALKYYPNNTHNNSDTEQLRLLKGILTCNFHDLEDITRFYVNNKTFGAPAKSKAFIELCRRFRHHTTNKYNTITAERCPIPTDRMADVLGRACRANHLTVTKTIRLANISLLEPLTRQANLDLRILHLVRDPRGTVASRLALRHRKDNVTTFFADVISESEVEVLCQTILMNLQLNKNVTSWLHERYALLRYEDVAEGPIEKTRKLYKSLGVPMHKAVYRWIRLNTNTTDAVRAPFSTRRKSKERTSGWRSALSFSQVQMIQEKCHETMDLLGYREIQSERELSDMSIRLYRRTVSESSIGTIRRIT